LRSTERWEGRAGPTALLFAGAVFAQVVPGGFGLLIWAGTLAVLSYVLARLVADREAWVAPGRETANR
jgi:hypothetical protein